MKFVIQRVTHASVAVDDEVVGAIQRGFLVLIGIRADDTQKEADLLVHKLSGLRIFEDENGKTNLSLRDVNGAVLLVSQFTLCANCRKGNRPSFTDAMEPEAAKALYHYIIRACRELLPTVQTGRFGAHMEVELQNDGPFTVILDSDDFR